MRPSRYSTNLIEILVGISEEAELRLQVGQEVKHAHQGKCLLQNEKRWAGRKGGLKVNGPDLFWGIKELRGLWDIPAS